MTQRNYTEELYDRFEDNIYGGFVDWRHCGNLEYEVCNLLDQAAADFLKDNKDTALFQLVCEAYILWAETEKDDSGGETQMFIGTAFEIWNQIYEREHEEMPHDRMLAWFLSKMDGSLIDYMEEFLLEYVMDHFTEPELLQRKQEYLNRRLEEKTRLMEEKSWAVYDVQRCKEYLLRIYCDQRRPIQEIREYAGRVSTSRSRELLAEIELNYGYSEQAIAIYRELAEEVANHWDTNNYNGKLKDLYLQYGYQEEYAAQVRKLLQIRVGDSEIWEEYKALLTEEEWPEAVERLFASFAPSDQRPFRWYKEEGRYDLIMRGIELGGPWQLEYYEDELSRRYPDRCLAVLVTAANREAENSKNRKDYRHIARYLRWMWKYPGGVECASELAEMYRKRYPRRTALIDELRGI